MADERDMSDLVDEFCDFHSLYHFEGDSGLRKLETFLKALGYKGHNFKYGSIIESFLSDNSGAVLAMMEWVREQNNTEWKDNLESELPEGDEEEDEDTDDEEN